MALSDTTEQQSFTTFADELLNKLFKIKLATASAYLVAGNSAATSAVWLTAMAQAQSSTYNPANLCMTMSLSVMPYQ